MIRIECLRIPCGKDPTKEENVMNKCDYPFHDHFFVFYIIMGSTLLLLNLQIVLVIPQSKCLWKLSGYRIIFLSSAADAVNCATQLASVALTFHATDIHPTTDMFLGAVFQASVAAECLAMLVLSANRLVAVIFPKKMDLIFDRKKTTVRECNKIALLLLYL
ncbi:hypothetical protein KIN20_020496 [Parelaphostrongylus tenuis]|uniref:7TM GPCR serpentine receptor class x (Srx) domain-containing protein n=1 Tax=Parelaphostrongylus tenuis TaxID=148309 RepID=A0AAD5MMI7_PARTN|nr:hypothetical protein KIN20_020496 [Parelaphostrongylus tenuis]